DEEDMREWLRLVLAPLRAEIREAASGGELLRVLASDPLPDLVITDVRMPPPDGLEVLARVRARGSSVPFLVISAFADEAVRAEAARHGAEVLAKPFTGKQLLARVRQLLPEHGVTRPAPTGPEER
ncbi:MAG: response regulator, partial [Deltaproteobacteria bacterium]|nr:response regulator [Deltaproteobacteria bacterium]